MSYPYMTFAREAGTETFYQPAGDELDNLARELAYDVFYHQHILRQAYADRAVSMKVLVPRSFLPNDYLEYKTATVVGVPVEIVEDIDEPMVAYSLKRIQVPM